jgi:hypothetical protein
MNDDTKALVRLSQEYGWDWFLTGSNHLFGKAPDGETKMTIGLRTPAWNSAFKNAKAVFRKYADTHPLIEVEPAKLPQMVDDLIVLETAADPEPEHEPEPDEPLRERYDDGDEPAPDEGRSESEQDEEQEILYPALKRSHGSPLVASDRYDEVVNAATGQVLGYRCRLCGDTRLTLKQAGHHYGAKHVRFGDQPPGPVHQRALAKKAIAEGAARLQDQAAVVVHGMTDVLGQQNLPEVPPEVEAQQILARMSDDLRTLGKLLTQVATERDQAEQALETAKAEWDAWLGLMRPEA